MAVAAARQVGSVRPGIAAPTQRLLQRKCACGTHTPSGGTCEACAGKKRVQRKLTIGSANDPLEHEADRIAEHVVALSPSDDVSRTPPAIQRVQSTPTDEHEDAPESAHRVLERPGRSLEAPFRRDMEERFGHDFSNVRVHHDAEATHSATDVGARAYTVGSNIVFGAGQYAPETFTGRRLIAHELTHVIQQSSANRQGSARMMRDAIDPGSRDHRRGGTLPYREAKEYADCIRIMGPESAEYCRREVLGEEPAPCPLGIQGPADVNHFCAAYRPSDAASCGVFPAPNITLRAQGAAAGRALTWTITRGVGLASIIGPRNGATVEIRGDAPSLRRGDVEVMLSDGRCTTQHTLTVREPSNFTTTQAPTAGPSFIRTTVDYTVRDQFNAPMGAGICIDETITICSRSHPVSPTFGDAPTNARGQAQDTLEVAVASGTLPAAFCIKLNQSLTAGGCGPLLNNTILFQPGGITLTPNSRCAVGDPCP